MNKEEISKANKLYDEGVTDELYEFIAPFLKEEDPHAFYFYSRFSLPEWNESGEEHDRRYVELLTKAAEGGVAEAMYRLSSLYFTGEIVTFSTETGRRYLDRARELNFGEAKLSVGINLFYGSNGYPKNVEKAFIIVAEAARDNVDGASEVLEKM